MKNWTYTHPHAPRVLTMHDCIVTRIDLESGEDGLRMTWHLPDGIWIAPEISGHDMQKTCRTAEACAVFSDERLSCQDDLVVSVCRRSRWHGKDKRLLTETWSYMTLADFIKEFTAKGWSMEIIETYTEHTSFYVTGEINTPKERRWREFRMTFNAETAHYYWDTIRPDRVW